MKFLEIAKRITGLSTAVFGVSWSPTESERAVAKRVIVLLEDRRVLYEPSQMETPKYCIQSVIEIRRLLTDEIGRLSDTTELGQSLRAMRAACRKFLSQVESDKSIIQFATHCNHYASWHFNAAVGELRGVFGVHLALLATRFGLDIEGDLAGILPEPP